MPTPKPWIARWDFRFFILLIITSLTSLAALSLSSRDYVYYHSNTNYVRTAHVDDAADTFNYSQSKPVLVLMWDGGTPFSWGDGEVVHPPNYGGFTYNKGKCPVQCEWTKDRKLLPAADTVLFDVCLTGPNGFREIPVYMPDKFPGQQWGWFTYEQYVYFPMMLERDYMDHFDYKMTYHHDAEIQITFACPWAGVSDLLAPVPKKDTEKVVAVFISNCGTGGADKRLKYIEELMKYVKVDSFGHCLHNKDAPFRGGSHGNKMGDKISTISEYKFMLAFENNEIEDYVTEKLINAYQAGTVPVYMGSPTIDKWQIAEHSLIKLSDYPNPKDLGEYLNYLNTHDDEYMKYFEWKKTGISKTFQRLWDNCFAFAECRLCKYIARSREAIGDFERPPGMASSGVVGYALQLNGLDSDLNGGDDYVEIPYNAKLDVSEEYTLMAWIKLAYILDGRIIDKNTAGEVSGFNFDVVAVDSNNANKGYLRLCAGEGCYQSKRLLGLGLWYHVAATATMIDENKQQISFYINGKLDSEHTSSKVTATNRFPVRFGRATNGGGSWRPHHAASIFDGVIDEVSMWSAALTQEEIYDYQFLRPYGEVDDLIAWWNFNEGTGEIIHDSGPNGLHGRTVGSPTWIVSVSKPVLDPSTAEGRAHN